MPLIQFPEARHITTVSDNVLAAIVDKGQTNHPDLIRNRRPEWRAEREFLECRPLFLAR